MKKIRALSCLILAIFLMFYGIPRLPISNLSDFGTGFSVIWTLFALLVIGGNLMFVLQDRQKVKKHQHVVKQDKMTDSSSTKKRRVSIDL